MTPPAAKTVAADCVAGEETTWSEERDILVDGCGYDDGANRTVAAAAADAPGWGRRHQEVLTERDETIRKEQIQLTTLKVTNYNQNS
jgi:hypothetical protein